MAAAGCKAALIALLCAACTSIAADARTFEGTRWRIVAINAAATPAYPVEFRRGRMVGVICNHFEAPYVVSGAILGLGGRESTERGCSSPTSDHEESAFAIIRRPMQMRWSSGRRLILSNSIGSISLERLP